MRSVFPSLSLSILLCLRALPCTAQEPLTFPLSEVLALSDAAHQSEAAFTDSLAAILPVTLRSGRPLTTDLEDPFLWAISGSIGTTLADTRPGAIFSCARYGLATRDAFAERGLLDPEMFALMGAVQQAYDDAQRWPDGAVARLACDFVWDDARTVAIVPRDVAEGALAPLFGTVYDVTGALTLFGEEGFSLLGVPGRDNAVTQVDTGQVVLTLGHQQVRFRSFLMGGGT